MRSVSPRMTRRWAEIFVQKERDEGLEAASEWADRTLNASDALAVSKEISRIKEPPTKQPPTLA
jgi:hypothetical protein